jgi:hypothetical protein
MHVLMTACSIDRYGVDPLDEQLAENHLRVGLCAVYVRLQQSKCRACGETTMYEEYCASLEKNTCNRAQSLVCRPHHDHRTGLSTLMVSRGCCSISLRADKISQAFSDRLLGGLLLGVSSFIFTYYTIWALVTVSNTAEFAGVHADRA